MGAFSPILSLLLLFGGLLLPGYALARRFGEPRNLLEDAVYSVGFGLFVIPTISFAAAWILDVPYSLTLVLAVALGVVVFCRPWAFAVRAPSQRRKAELVVLAALVLGAFLLLQWTELYSLRGFRFLDCCLHSVASYLRLGNETTFALYDPWSGGDVTYILAHPTEPVKGLRLWAFEQRPLNGAIVALLVNLAGHAGLQLLTALVFFAVAGAASLVAGMYLRSLVGRAIVGLLTLVALHGLMGYMVNESTFALTAAIVLFALLIRPDAGPLRLLMAGFLLGSAFGSRAAGILLALPVLLMVLRCSKSRWFWALPVTFAGFVLSAMPWLVAYAILKDHPFAHTNELLEITHSFFGHEYLFRPLNWPFFSQFVRPPSDVLPTMFYVPVKMLLSAGSLVMAAAAVGLCRLPRKGGLRSDLAVVLAWAGPFSLLMLFLADMDHERITWLLIVMPVLPVLLARFGAAVLERGRARTIAVVSWALLAAGLGFVPWLAAAIEVQEDPRELPWYIADGDAFHPNSMVETREDLVRPAFLPSGQELVTTSHLLSSFLHRAGEAQPTSGRTFVRLDGHGTTVVDFPLATPEMDVTLPDAIAFTPSDLINFANQYLLVHVLVDGGDEMHVTVTGKPGLLHVAIEPGEEPHAKRYVTLLIDEQMSDDLEWGQSADTLVTLDGQTVPTHSVGWIVDKDGVKAAFPTLATNLALPEQPRKTGAFSCEGTECRYEWHRLSTVPVEDGVPTMDISGPTVW